MISLSESEGHSEKLSLALVVQKFPALMDPENYLADMNRQ